MLPHTPLILLSCHLVPLLSKFKVTLSTLSPLCRFSTVLCSRLDTFSEYQKPVGIFEEKLENQLSNLIGVWGIRKNPFQAGNWSLAGQKAKSKWPPFFTDNLIISKSMFLFNSFDVGFFH